MGVLSFPVVCSCAQFDALFDALGLEHAIDELRLVRAGQVVRVDHRRLDVCVAHPRLQGPQRHAAGCAPGAEGVAEVVLVPTSAQIRICRCRRYADVR
jgi:hypothetical protein